MPIVGEHTIDEITSQPAAWRSALDSTLACADALRRAMAQHTEQPLVMLGSGSPYYLAIAAAALARDYAGRQCVAAPSAELIFHPHTIVPRDGPILAVIFSRSGETSEALAAARMIQHMGGAVIAVGCDAATSLMRLADVAVEVAEGREESLAQTRSFAGMYLAAQAIVGLLRQLPGDTPDYLIDSLRQLPLLGPAYISRAHAAVGTFATDPAIERIYVLGAGIRYGIACETALKFQEMSLTNIHAYYPLEFRHGPMSMADDRALVIGLIGETNAREELAVLAEAHALGARVVAIAERLYPEMSSLNQVFTFESGLPEHARTLLYLPPLQLMAYERAIAKGLNPDSPRHVTKFVRVANLEGPASATQ